MFYPKKRDSGRRHANGQDGRARRGKVYIYGKHALMEALRYAPQAVRKVHAAKNARGGELEALFKERSIAVAPLSGGGDGLVGKDAVHQGVIATIDPSSLLVPFDTFLNSLDLTKRPALALLAEIQDPHNVGAVIRSAAAFGLSGVLIPERRQAPITGAVVKSSAGMAFRVPLVSIGNINHTLETLKKKGFWTYALSARGASTPSADSFDRPTVFVIGNEGAGIREKTLELCDVNLKIPMHERTESLNAAAAAAIVFYEWSRKHPEAL